MFSQLFKYIFTGKCSLQCHVDCTDRLIFSVASNSALTLLINNYTVSITFVVFYGVKENHSKSFALFFNSLLILLPMSIPQPTVFAERLIVLNNFIFSEHTSWNQTQFNWLIISKWLPLLGYQMSHSQANFVYKFCRDEIVFLILYFLNQCFTVN